MHDEYDAESGYESDENAGAVAQLKSGLSVILGATLAIALVGGLGLWFLDLSERQAAEIPVLRASTEPAKIRPADGGGAEAPHLEIRSYEIASNGEAIGEEVKLAPPTERPSEEDVAMGDLPPEDDDRLLEDELAGTTKPAPRPSNIPQDDLIESAKALIGEPAKGGTDQAPSYAPVAAGRPKDLAKKFRADASTSSVELELIARAQSSEILVQLGAFPERGIANREWKAIYSKHGDILAGRALVIQPTVSGGTTFQRLRAGPFRDRTEANSVCEALRARGQDCLVATNEGAG